MFTDVTLACNGKLFPAHKFVLSTCSEYFEVMFQETHCKHPIVVLKDVECRHLEFLLDYMYLGEVNVPQNSLSSLIAVAECLRIRGLAVPDEPTQDTKANLKRHSKQLSSPKAKRRRDASPKEETPLRLSHNLHLDTPAKSAAVHANATTQDFNRPERTSIEDGSEDEKMVNAEQHSSEVIYSVYV